jgi:hypothetical protein
MLKKRKVETLRESAYKVRYVGLPQCIKLGGLYLRDKGVDVLADVVRDSTS